MKCACSTIVFIFFSILLFSQTKASVCGYVTDYETGESLIGAGIRSGDAVCVTNNYGYYSLNVEGGPIQVTYSYVGYESQVIKMTVSADTLVRVTLRPSEVIADAYVTAYANDGIRSSFNGALRIPADYIKSMPALLGEADVLKVLQKTPGVQAGMEGFSGLYVRGGGAEENLQLYDGVPLYNVSHLLGLLSVYVPEAIKDVSFFKGSFPARYGGRVSSIVDVRTNEGNSEKVSGTISVGLLTENLHIEGPFKNKATTYSLSARVMPTSLFERLLVDKTGYGYSFYDFNGKIFHRLKETDKFTLSLYKGKDRYLSEASDNYNSNIYSQELKEMLIEKHEMNKSIAYNWGNTMAALRWNHVFSSRLFSDFCVSWTDYKSERDENSKTEVSVERLAQSKKFKSFGNSGSGISDVNLEAIFEYSPNFRNLMVFGLQSVYHKFTPKSDVISVESSGYATEKENISHSSGYSDNYKGLETALFYEDNINLGDKFFIDIGSRATLFNTQEKAFFVLEPRLSAQYHFNSLLSAKIGYSRMSQYVHLLNSSMTSLPTDLWVPITRDIRPVISDILSAGVYGIFDGGWYINLEGYWKRMYNVLEYIDGMSYMSSSDWSDAVSSGNGLSRGLELLVEKKTGKTTGWLSYTLSKSERWFPDGKVNNGEKFPYTYDRRHNVNCSIFHKFSESFDLNASWTLYSGNMMTLPTRVAMVYGVYYGTDIPYVQSRNNYRLPSTHHLDLAVNTRKKMKHGLRTWSLGIYNLYCQKNPNIIEQYVDYKNTDGSGLTSSLEVKKTTLLMAIPSISYTFSF